MKKHKNTQERPEYLKRKLTSALCMLLIASVLLGSASYAWLVMSVAPEVSGMTANVGANGSLEIALLDAETREDLSKISSLGGSLQSMNANANKSWGNILDLSYDTYGLQELVLWPSRLNMSGNADNGYVVDINQLLSVPTYGYDGRIVALTNDTVTGTFDGKGFSYTLGVPDFGVRVVGTANSLTPQAAALAMANSNIKTATNSAKNAAKLAISNNADALINMIASRGQENPYGEQELATILNMIDNLDTSLGYIDTALRQGLIAFAASKIGDETLFEQIKNTISSAADLNDAIDQIEEALNNQEQEPDQEATGTATEPTGSESTEATSEATGSTEVTEEPTEEPTTEATTAPTDGIQTVDETVADPSVAAPTDGTDATESTSSATEGTSSATEGSSATEPSGTEPEEEKPDVQLPSDYTAWIDKLNAAKNSLNNARVECEKLKDIAFGWTELKTPLSYIMNVDKVLIGDKTMDSVSTNDLMNLVTNGKEIEIGIPSGSGVFADVSDFAGDYSYTFTYTIAAVSISTITTEDPVHLAPLATFVGTLEPSSGEIGKTKVDLSSTFGYVVDMAFRTNAAVSDLLLQTTASQRVYANSDNERTLGGGSYMEFTTQDQTFTLEQMLELMDAIRVAFIDDQGNVLGIAKLNTVNRVYENGVVKAPLYLYTFHIDEEDGSLQMDERQKNSNAITALEQNTAKAISSIVWLDGDIVDNSKVSATEEMSLRGTLNLQFASSAELLAADNNVLMNITADKTSLNTLLEEEQETYDLGQGAVYTSASWDAYEAAFNNAVSVYESESASELQIFNAIKELQESKKSLTLLNHDALTEKITHYRKMMGKTEDPARYVLQYESGKYYSVSAPTQEQIDTNLGIIYQVDYNNNLNDEGNGVKTPIYTDESWRTLAAALYDAETVNMDPNATSDEIDHAISMLDFAYDSLVNNVYYIAYEYQGDLYYRAVSDETDTYGLWYYPDKTRVTSDLLILKLNAKAEPADIAYISCGRYVEIDDSYVIADINFYKWRYSELHDEEIIAIHWSDFNLFDLGMSRSQNATLSNLITEAEKFEDFDADLLKSAKSMRYSYSTPIADAAAMIETMAAAVAEKLAEQEANASDPTEDPNATDPTETTPAETVPEETIPSTENAAISAETRFVLQKAIEEAKRILGITDDEVATAAEDPTAPAATESTEPAATESSEPTTGDDVDSDAALTQLVEEAEQLLADDTSATEEQAQEKLTALNDALKEYGVGPFTIYNSYPLEIPVTSEQFELIYTYEDSHTLIPKGVAGTETLSAVVLTRSGVVFTTSVELTVYYPAYDADISGYSKENHVVGDTIALSVDLLDYRTPRLDEAGNYVYDDEGHLVYDYHTHGNTIDEITWSTEDMNIATVSSDGIVTGIAAGTTTIHVRVETVEGNVFNDEIEISISAE